MNSSILVAVLLALCGAGDAFLQDLLVQPHAMSPYRRAVYEAPQAPHQPIYSSPGYVNSRPIIYQWLPARPGSYEVGSGYSYGSSNNNNNPFMTFLQNPWFPWSNRQPQPLQQPQQQPQQPLWSFLPWSNNNNNNNAGHQPASNPVFNFLQNPAGILPWTNRPASGVIYTPPTPAGQVVSEQHLAPSSSPVGEPMAEDGVVQHIPAQDMNAIRRVNLQQDDSIAVPCS